MNRVIIFLTFVFFINPATYATFEVKKFQNVQQEQRYKKLIDELRCLVCQNQNLADSNAQLAQDLRKQVFKMINAGQSDEEILNFMVTRYGDFVLYRPPFNASTFLLWVGPFVIFLVGLIVLIRFIRLRKNVVVASLNNTDKAKINKLLDDDKDQSE